jgi:hypothetical protein
MYTREVAAVKLLLTHAALAVDAAYTLDGDKAVCVSPESYHKAMNSLNTVIGLLNQDRDVVGPG